MADGELSPLFRWFPWPPIGDPGPEIFAILNSLPPEQQAQVVKVISEARAQINTVKSNAHAQIGEVMGAVVGGGRGAT